MFCPHPRFRDLGAAFSSFGCFVFEIWVLRTSVFVFEYFVFETTLVSYHIIVQRFEQLVDTALYKCLLLLLLLCRSMKLWNAVHIMSSIGRIA